MVDAKGTPHTGQRRMDWMGLQQEQNSMQIQQWQSIQRVVFCWEAMAVGAVAVEHPRRVHAHCSLGMNTSHTLRRVCRSAQ
jgi:hypothetical protein